MEKSAIQEIIRKLKNGSVYEVPFSTTLYAETHVVKNILSQLEDGQFQLQTKFHEFAAGHGFSTELDEKEIWSVDQIEKALGWADEATVKLLS